MCVRFRTFLGLSTSTFRLWLTHQEASEIPLAREIGSLAPRRVCALGTHKNDSRTPCRARAFSAHYGSCLTPSRVCAFSAHKASSWTPRRARAFSAHYVSCLTPSRVCALGAHEGGNILHPVPGSWRIIHDMLMILLCSIGHKHVLHHPAKYEIHPESEEVNFFTRKMRWFLTTGSRRRVYFLRQTRPKRFLTELWKILVSNANISKCSK